jgi:amino acid adenylation domain-containing protein
MEDQRVDISPPADIEPCRNTIQQIYPQNIYVPQLVELQASVTPEAVAVVANGQEMSYGELNQRANQLAHTLRARGVGSDDLVGLCVERTCDMVVGLLGILKAGGAYVPLDFSYPSDRLHFIIEDAHALVLVTQQALVDRLSTQSTQVICLDTHAALLAQQSTLDPCPSIAGDDLAYVIYTSGSTGQPKGVEITQQSLLNLVRWHQRAFEITPTDRATQLTSPAFDATGWELWPYLTIGASVYLLDEECRAVPALCRDWLLGHGITITFLPTPLAEEVMTLEWPLKTSLRYLLTGADTLQHYPPPALPFALINNYGPTETTVVATFGRVFPTELADQPPAIGRPIDNVQVYILDEHLRQVPFGEPGELCIGGVGLAKGYHNRPNLTSAKFITHQFSDEPAARLYRTGDLACYLPDGQIAFLGRIDHQIKIRGYRIEPNEIVSLLNGHPSVQTSLVIAREDIPGDKRLVAYLVLFPSAHVTTRSLREILERRLPDYMMPATYVELETLPLTPNGKIDRAALPPPDATNILRDEVLATPCTPTQERLTSIVAPLLSLEQVGLDENFFMLGGHSLLGTQLISCIANTFGVSLSLYTLFEAPTVRELSVEIERHIIARLKTMSDDEALRLFQ